MHCKKAVTVLAVLLFISQSVSAFNPFGWFSGQIRQLWDAIFGLEKRVDALESTSTTTIPDWECITDSDCGGEEYDYVCTSGDVYRITKKNICVEHACQMRESTDLFDNCKEDEVCVDREQYCQPKPTTTTTTSTIQTTTTQSTSTSTSVTTTTVAGGECTSNGDCGEPYYSDIRCSNARMYKIYYEPLCDKGHCLVQQEQRIIRSCTSDEECIEGKGCSPLDDGTTTTTLDSISKKIIRCEQEKNQEKSDDCFWDIANDERDSTYCEYINNEDRKRECLITYNEDIGVCHAIENPYYRQQCYIEFSRIYPKHKYCELIEDNSRLIECYHNVAERTHNPEDCRLLKTLDRYAHDVCLWELVEEDYITDYNICKEMDQSEGVGFYLSGCIEYFAAKVGDDDYSIDYHDLCGITKGCTVQAECYNIVGRKLSDEEICYKICTDTYTSTDKLLHCLVQVASDKKDIAICLDILDNEDIMGEWYSGRDGWICNCFKSVAQSAKNPEICEQIPAKTPCNKDNCYSALANELGDWTICEKIENEGDRVRCFQHAT